MWSNAFSQTLELEFPDRSRCRFLWFGRNVRAIVARPTGGWSLRLRGGERVEARLVHGWVAGGGRIAGLSWAGPDGRRFHCGLCCLLPGGDAWRRLLVRLRVPMSSRLS